MQWRRKRRGSHAVDRAGRRKTLRGSHAVKCVPCDTLADSSSFLDSASCRRCKSKETEKSTERGRVSTNNQVML